MFDKYMIVDRSLTREEDGVGFDLRIPYYRGLGLSMVDSIRVEIDGEEQRRSDLTLTVRGRTFRVAELEGVLDERWRFGEAAHISVAGSHLAVGTHRLKVSVTLRVSYLVDPAVTTYTKELELQ